MRKKKAPKPKPFVDPVEAARVAKFARERERQAMFARIAAENPKPKPKPPAPEGQVKKKNRGPVMISTVRSAARYKPKAFRAVGPNFDNLFLKA